MKYAMICCTGEALAYIDVPRRGSVTVTPASERPHMSIAVNPVIDGKQVWTAEQMHEMTTAGAVERHVTEIQWASHRGWIVRCGEGTCSQQVELSNLNLRKLADLLAGGAWPEVDGMYIVPLRVLNPILRQLNR